MQKGNRGHPGRGGANPTRKPQQCPGSPPQPCPPTAHTAEREQETGRERKKEANGAKGGRVSPVAGNTTPGLVKQARAQAIALTQRGRGSAAAAEEHLQEAMVLVGAIGLDAVYTHLSAALTGLHNPTEEYNKGPRPRHPPRGGSGGGNPTSGWQKHWPGKRTRATYWGFREGGRRQHPDRRSHRTRTTSTPRRPDSEGSYRSWRGTCWRRSNEPSKRWGGGRTGGGERPRAPRHDPPRHLWLSLGENAVDRC